MAKIDNPHALRLYESILAETDASTADDIIQELPLSKSADYVKKFAWAEQVCEKLDSKFDKETVKRIRMGCACGPETGKLGKLRKAYEKATDLIEFVQKANSLKLGFSLETDGKDLFMIYPSCYCSCVKRVNTPLPESWCYCTLGYTKRAFDFVLDTDTQVELLESVKTGGTCCRIKVRFS